jgi:hypothetical protein
LSQALSTLKKITNNIFSALTIAKQSCSISLVFGMHEPWWDNTWILLFKITPWGARVGVVRSELQFKTHLLQPETFRNAGSSLNVELNQDDFLILRALFTLFCSCPELHIEPFQVLFQGSMVLNTDVLCLTSLTKLALGFRIILHLEPGTILNVLLIIFQLSFSSFIEGWLTFKIAYI